MRSSTAVLYDVTFSDTEVAVGERFTVSGTVRIMRSWPQHTVGPPETGFLSVIAPGPVVAVERREMNGVVTPQAVYIEKGATYDFRLDLVARRAGSWHVHPSFAVEGVGTLVGRGAWVAIADGEYTPTATALDGGTIDLSTVGLGRVVTWHLLGAALAVGWLAYWLRRPLLARLGAVDAGRGGSLVTRRDTAVGIGFAGAALALVGAGALVTAATVPDTVPIQVARVTPELLPPSDPLVRSEVGSVVVDPDAGVVRMELSVRNRSAEPVSLSRLQVAEQELTELLPDPAVPSGGEETITVEVDLAVLAEHNLLPLDEPQARLTGLLFFSAVDGAEQVSEVDEVTAPVLPS